MKFSAEKKEIFGAEKSRLLKREVLLAGLMLKTCAPKASSQSKHEFT